MNTEANYKIDRAIEAGFERIAYALDDVARKHGLTNKELLSTVRNWDRAEYYDEWINGSWESE